MIPLILSAMLLSAPSASTLETARGYAAVQNFDSAIPLFEAYIADFPETVEGRELLVSSLRLRAGRAFTAGNITSAIRDITRAMQVEPNLEILKKDFAVLNAVTGQKLLESGDTEGARDLFKKAITFDSTNLSIRRIASNLEVKVGDAYMSENRPMNAIFAYRSALENDSTNIQAHLALGQIYYSREEFELAKHHLRSARELSSSAIRGLDELMLKIEKEESVSKNYQTIEASNFVVRFEGAWKPELFYQALPILEEARERAGRLFERTSRKQITIIIYSGDGYQRSSEAPDWSAGIYDGKIRLREGELLRDPRYLTKIIRHEVAHAMIEELAPEKIPAWLHEGFSRYLEGERWDPLTDASYLVNAIKDRRTILFSDLAKPFASLPGNTDIRLAYVEAGAAVKFLAENFGEHSLADMMTLFSAGRNTEQVIDSITFCDLNLFQKRVEDWVIWEYAR